MRLTTWPAMGDGPSCSKLELRVLSAALACSSAACAGAPARSRASSTSLPAAIPRCEQLLVALQVEPGVLQLGLGLRDRGRRLPLLVLDRARSIAATTWPSVTESPSATVGVMTRPATRALTLTSSFGSVVIGPARRGRRRRPAGRRRPDVGRDGRALRPEIASSSAVSRSARPRRGRSEQAARSEVRQGHGCHAMGAPMISSRSANGRLEIEQRLQVFAADVSKGCAGLRRRPGRSVRPSS